MSHREDAEVEVVEAVALGQRAREPVLGQRAALEQHPLGRRAGSARGLDRALDLLARDEPQVDDHVGQEARRGAPARGRGDARPLLARRAAWTSIVRSTSAVARRARRLRRSPARRRDRSRPCAARARGPPRSRCRRSRAGPGPFAERPRSSRQRSRVGAARSLAGGLVSCRALSVVSAARRMTSRGASRPVHSSKLSAPCATRISSPSTVPRAVRPRGSEQRGGIGAIDEVDDIGVPTDLIERQPELVEPLRLTGRPF